jgi:hypothetical protein
VASPRPIPLRASVPLCDLRDLRAMLSFHVVPARKPWCRRDPFPHE